jgi:hypothetical protein
LGDAQFRCGLAEVAFARDGEEVAQVSSEIHGVTLVKVCVGWG